MKNQSALEFLENYLKIKGLIIHSPNNPIMIEAKEIEKDQQEKNEKEVIEFAKWILKFDNLKNPSDFVIKELFAQFKEEPVKQKISIYKIISYGICVLGIAYFVARFILGTFFNI